jgi:predicted permease
MCQYSHPHYCSPKSLSSSRQVRVHIIPSGSLVLIPEPLEKLRELWIVPFFFVITTTVSMIVAYLLGTAFRLKRSQRSFAMAAAMFMNSNSLPIALMQSLVITVPGLKWGEHDTRSAMIGRALTYLVLHSTLGMVVRRSAIIPVPILIVFQLRWSYGVRLLAQADDEVTSAPHPVGEAEAVSPLLDRDETAFPPPPGEHEALRAHRLPNNRMPGDTEANVWGQWPAPDSSEAANNEVPARPEYQGSPILVHTASNRFLRPSATRKSTGVFHSFPNSPAQMATPLPIVSGGQTPQSGTTEVPTPDEGGVDEFPAPVTRTRSAPTWWSRFTKRAKAFWTAFNDFMTVPLWAALASLIVALVQPLQHGLDEHFPPIKNALDQAGKCSIPITLIVLGAYFYQPPDPEAEAKRTGEIRLGAEETDEERRNRNRLSQTSLVGSVKSMFKLDTFGKRNHEEVPEVHPGETRTVWVAVLSRMVITPLLLLPAIALSAYLDWHSVFEE